MKIGITERGDAGLDTGWIKKLNTVDGAILISKHPGKLLEILSDLPMSQLDGIIVHCTITGHGSSNIEPGVPHPVHALVGYKALLEMFGPERCVLRVDPIFPSERGTALARAILKHAGGRARISFVDAYDHVRFRFRAAGLSSAFDWMGLHAPFEQRQKAFDLLQGTVPTKLEVCGEPGFSCTGCVSIKDFKALNLKYTLIKDDKRKQRPECACATAEKTELLTQRQRCSSSCLYCYWKDQP